MTMIEVAVRHSRMQRLNPGFVGQPPIAKVERRDELTNQMSQS